MKYKSYKELEVYKLAHHLAVEIHKMTITQLPKFELYEEGSQIRRSSKSISTNIVEGFGRRRYKNEFIYFLTNALASCDETREHLDILYDTESLRDNTRYEYLIEKYKELGKRMTKFIQAVEKKHLGSKTSIEHQGSGIQSRGR